MTRAWYASMWFPVVSLIFFVAVLAWGQAERPIIAPRPPQEDCDWMYQKAKETAMLVDSAKLVTPDLGLVEMWTRLYKACREHNR